jgi:hypothetical protein
MGIGPGGVIRTTISWVTSPLHVPLRTLAGEKLPADGADVCNVTLGASNRPAGPAPGCVNLGTGKNSDPTEPVSDP